MSSNCILLHLGNQKFISYESTESEYTDSNNTNDKINHDTDNNVTKVEKQKKLKQS